MENLNLHAQKVAILSRLVKESSLTLEEALLLLKEEEEQIVQESVQPTWIPSTTTPYTPYVGGSGFPLTGTITVPNHFGITTNTTGVSTTLTTTSNVNADLNN